jgi:hypothetical protein
MRINAMNCAAIAAVEVPMSLRQRIVYISKASFSVADRASTVEPEIGRILMQSRRNNPARGLVGALYYGDGHFFQVLEGEPASIDALLDTQRNDPRHHDLTVLLRQPIEHTSSGCAIGPSGSDPANAVVRESRLTSSCPDTAYRVT